MNTKTTTEIRVRRIPASGYFILSSKWGEAHWLADLVEDGKQVWFDAFARSYTSADDAKRQLLDILDGKRGLQTGEY